MFLTLDLFSGIGGFSLGLERTGGFQTEAFCEISPFSRSVLANRWPGVPCYNDVRTLTAKRLASDGHAAFDVICGGFPCQDISVNGRNRGLAGTRSGLWFEMLRIIDEVRPRFVIAENVAALCSRGLDVVLGGIAALGYCVEWHCISAAAIGAPHERDRVWIVADAQGGRRRVHRNERGTDRDAGTGQSPVGGEGLAEWIEPIVGPAAVRRQAAADKWRRAQPGVFGNSHGLPTGLDGDRPIEAWEGNRPRLVAKGYPNRRPRLIAVGNSVAPDIPEMIGRCIIAASARKLNP